MAYKGKLSDEISPCGAAIGYTYDRNNRLTRVEIRKEAKDAEAVSVVSHAFDPAGNRRNFVYNDAGELTEETDARGNITKYEYTLSGRLKAVTDALGNRAEYAYDDEGRLIHICQKGKAGEKNREDLLRTDYTYDNRGNLVREETGDSLSL